MDLKLKALINPDYDELSALFLKVENNKSEKHDEDFVPFTPNYTNFSVNKTFTNLNLFFGIFTPNDKLVGTIGSTLVPVSFQNTSLLSSAITFYAIDPDLLPLERETLRQIFQQLINQIREFDVDFVWVYILKSINLEEMKTLKEDLQFIRMNKNVEGLVKLLGSEGVSILRKKKDLNIVLAQLAKVMAGMKTMPVPGGKIRDATPNDYPRIVELLNAYSDQLILTQLWTLEHLQRYIEVNRQLNHLDYSSLKSEFPDTPFGFHMKLWERDQKIIAAILYRIAAVRFKHGDAPFGFWDYVAFSQDLDPEEKKAFIITMYNQLYHKAIIINLSLPYYDFKTFDKAGFMTERRKLPLFILPLTKEGKKLLELDRISKFYLPATDLAI